MPRRGETHLAKKQSSTTSCTDCPDCPMELDQRLGATSAIKSNKLMRKIFMINAFSRILVVPV